MEDSSSGLGQNIAGFYQESEIASTGEMKGVVVGLSSHQIG